jgi:hypothetical protein
MAGSLLARRLDMPAKSHGTQRKKTMLKLIKTATLSAMIGLGAMAAAPSTASADSIGIHFLAQNAGFGFYFGESGSARRDWDRRHDRRDRYERRDFCSPHDALRKAQWLGMRHARVTHVNYRTIGVEGRIRGYGHDRILFARAPHCPVLR